jgi:hypothetical protein
MKEELEDLLKELNEAYEKSDNKNSKYCLDKGRKWGYELVQSGLIENKPMVIGFNWGVDNTWKDYIDGKAYQHQTSIRKQNFMQINMASLKRAMNMCYERFENIDFADGSHSNFCFFRSEKEDQISTKDIDLCTPIFTKLMKIIKPSVVFCFSSKARNFLMEANLIVEKQEKIIIKKRGNRRYSFKVVKGKLSSNADVYCLPHPNSKIIKEVREEAWRFCAENQSQNSWFKGAF